jgi:hypothetical protein
MKIKFIIKENIVYIMLHKDKTTTISVDDLENVHENFQGTWYAKYDRRANNWYVYGMLNQQQIALHRFIYNTHDRQTVIDHINHDTLNNTRENLRQCTTQENQRNRTLQRGRTSKYKGVDWHNNSQKWRTRINVGKKQVHIGFFDDEVSAAKAYDKKAVEIFGEFALLNFQNLNNQSNDNNLK